ncbi:MAG: hypothetical protein Q4C54_04825 [Clostridia bacterium]|nr:hypothetical protein [Clostridia bacterium]
MNRMLRTITAVMLLVVMIFSCNLFAVAEGGTPVITKQPKDVKAAEGTKVTISVKATGATGIAWRLVNPESGQEVSAKEIPNLFEGMLIEGAATKELELYNVSMYMDGWQVYCKLKNDAGIISSDKATITVMDKDYVPTEEELAQEAAEAEAARQAEIEAGRVTITTVGCKVKVSGSGKSETTATVDKGKNKLVIKADKPSKVDYWVINGVRYDFSKVPTQMTITNLAEDMTVEAVVKKGTATTLLTEAQLKDEGKGGSKTVNATNASMKFVNSKGKVGGKKFTTFDFTEAYKNTYTKKEQEGGVITLRVTAKKKTYNWVFNGTKIKFNQRVSGFLVTNLNTSMSWEAEK